MIFASLSIILSHTSVLFSFKSVKMSITNPTTLITTHKTPIRAVIAPTITIPIIVAMFLRSSLANSPSPESLEKNSLNLFFNSSHAGIIKSFIICQIPSKTGLTYSSYFSLIKANVFPNQSLTDTIAGVSFSVINTVIPSIAPFAASNKPVLFTKSDINRFQESFALDINCFQVPACSVNAFAPIPSDPNFSKAPNRSSAAFSDSCKLSTVSPDNANTSLNTGIALWNCLKSITVTVPVAAIC
ncbi:MAG: hypothetical protein BWY21_01792 [Parcubacteria group bacterium ADurb.Bin216]|nr:MAG: hypothetical protein BWY21_01792 [Parcubacteria group bacterium ADurb.Bin216]